MNLIHSKEELDQAVSHNPNLVVVWSADWCPDCLFLNPAYPRLEAANPDIQFCKMDRDECLDTAIDMQIKGIPSFIYYQNGQEKGRLVNGLRKTEQEVQAFIDENKGE